MALKFLKNTAKTDYSVEVGIGELIEKWMDRREIKSLKELSNRAGVDYSTLWKIIRERQDPGFSKIKAIVTKGLGISMEEFFSLGGETPSSDRSTGEFTKEELDEWRGKFYGARGLIDDLNDEELARVVRIVRAVVEGERKKNETD